MPAKILVGNLPQGTTTAEVVELFQKRGAEVQVEITEEGDPNSLTAVVTLDVDQKTIQIMVDRFKDFFYKGRTLTFYAPMMMAGKD